MNSKIRILISTFVFLLSISAHSASESIFSKALGYCGLLFVKAPRTIPPDIKYFDAVQAKRDRMMRNWPVAQPAAAYLLKEHLFQWDWSRLNEGRVGINIAENSGNYSTVLKALAKIIVIHVNGYQGEGRWAPDQAIGPLGSNENLAFHMRITVKLDPHLLTQGPREQALILEEAIEKTSAPIGEPTIQVFNSPEDFLDYAVLLSELNVNTSSSWLEVRWTPLRAAMLRLEVERSIARARP